MKNIIFSFLQICFAVYINSVIAGIVVKAAVNQKKRENGTTAQFLPDPMKNNITRSSYSWNTATIQQHTCQMPH